MIVWMCSIDLCNFKSISTHRHIYTTWWRRANSEYIAYKSIFNQDFRCACCVQILVEGSDSIEEVVSFIFMGITSLKQKHNALHVQTKFCQKCCNFYTFCPQVPPKCLKLYKWLIHLLGLLGWGFKNNANTNLRRL